MKTHFYSVILFAACISCIDKNNASTYYHNTQKNKSSKAVKEIIIRDSSDYEKVYVKNGLVNISDLNKDIRVVLMYNSNINFLGKSFYNGLDQCYLQREVAIKLDSAQRLLKQQFPFYNLIVFDATRPLHIQKLMWDSLKMLPKEKYSYVARPDELSLHNFGAAVDVSIISNSGVLLDMGTPYDFFGDMAQPKLEMELFAKGELSKTALGNRLLLRKIMMQAGFNPITSEWWHFNSCTKVYAGENYVLLE